MSAKTENSLKIARPMAVPPKIPVSSPAPAAAPVIRRRQPSKRAREGVFRAVILALLIISVLLAVWSFALVLVPRQDQARKLSRELAKVSASVDEMERAWRSDDATQVTNRYDQVRTMLFADETALESWLGNLNETAAPLAMGLSTSFGAPSLQTTNDSVAIIPTTLAVEMKPPPEDQTMPSRYQCLLQLVQKLAAADKRTDIVELTVRGGTNSSESAVLVLDLWASEEGAQ